MKPRFLSALFLVALPMLAQLPAPNKAGVSAGHDVLRVKDMDAANKFWQALGGQPTQFAGTLNLIKFPGVLLLNINNAGRGGRGAAKEAPATPPPPAPELAGSEGSSLDFIGFSVKDLKASITKWAEAGITPLPGGSATQVYLMSPDKMKVRVTEDKSLATPIAADTIKMVVPNVAEAQAWYAKNSRRGDGEAWQIETVANIPGSSIVFEQAKGPVAPTNGRSFDRIGLEVAGLEAFTKKLEDNGVKLNNPYRKNDKMNAAFVVLVDPWGTQIEMSEGLSAVK